MSFNPDEFVTSAVLILFVIGIFVLFSNDLLLLFKSFKRSVRLSQYKKSSLYAHLERLLSVTLKKIELKNEVDILIGISFFIFSLLLIMLLNQGFGISSLLYSAAFSLMPYITLRVRLITARCKSSFEGERLITELLNQYKINFYNIISAIDKSVECLDKAPLSKLMLFRMARRIKTYTSSSELDKILDDFIYGINTEWSKKLVNNIHSALEDGSQIVVGLEDMLDDCKEVTKLMEEEKRSNLESVAIAKFLGPIMYVTLMFMASKYMNFQITDIVRYQIFTPGGLGMLMAIVLSCFGYFVIATILSNQKCDF